MKKNMETILTLALVLLFCISVHPQGASGRQEITITGTVQDQFGVPLLGVNVTEMGAPNGTITDEGGNYSIEVPKGNILSFTYTGMKNVERTVGDDLIIDVTLQEDLSELDEVVVVGYGEQKKEHLTGAIETIDVDDIEALPVGDLGTALAGRMLGVAVSGGSTRPGSKAQLTIRNPTSLSKDGGNNQPLYVIDGVLQIGAQGQNDATLFNNLDPSEIEGISILKDASAAVYGSRAANGVVLITTKRGKEGKPRFSYTGNYGLNDEAYRTKMLNAYEFGQYVNIMNGPYGANADSADPDSFFSQDELDHFRTIDYDWLDDAWSSSTSQRHALNASGGTEAATYFAGVSYYTQDGNFGPLDYDKWTFRAGTDLQVTPSFKAGIQLSGNFSEENKILSKIGGENDENDYRNLLRSPRYIPPYVNGFPVKLPGSGSTSGYHYFEIQNLNNTTQTRDKFMTLNLNAEYSVPFLEGLKIRGSYGRNMSGSRYERIGTRYELYDFERLGDNGHIYDGATVSGSSTYSNDNRITKSNTNGLSEQYNFTTSFDRGFGLHNVSALFSIERLEAESAQEDVYKEDPAEGTNGQFNTAFGTIDGRTFAYESGSLSYVGRLNYRYDDRYLAEFLYRTDASTKFAPENYWGNFYSLSAGWIVSNESFFESNTIDFLKFRYSFGKLGKDDTRPWLWRQRYTYQNGKGAVFGGNEPASTGIRMEASPNRAATWSDELKTNFGMEANFLRERLSFNLESFYNIGTNMLIERTASIPFTVGGTVASENYGEIDFFGYEVGLGWQDQIGQDFSYGIDTRFSWSDNKVIKSNFNEEDILLPWNAKPGQSTDFGVWGYDYLGMFRTQADVDAYVGQYNIQEVFETPVEELKPGMLYYRDIRGEYLGEGEFAAPDGIINENDQVKIASKSGNHYGFGGTLRLGYKTLKFSAVVAGSWGGFDEIDARDKMENEISSNYESVPALWNDIYDPDLNPTGTLPNPNYEDISLGPRSSFWEVDAFNLAVRNATLSYSLPKTLTDPLNLSNVGLNLTVLNPLTLYNPFDYKYAQGAWNNYPVLRTYSLGINISL